MKKVTRVKKIDVHAHAILFQEYEFPAHITMTPEQLIGVYDAINVEKGVLMPITSPECQTLVMSNGNTCELTHMYPTRFLWFCNVDPRLGQNSPKTDLSEYLLFYKNLGAKGMGELTANLYVDDPLMDNLFHHCEECDMAVTIHIAPEKGGYYGIVDEVGLPRLEKMLNKHPKLKIFGHSQAFWAEISSDCTQESRGIYPTGKIKEGRLAQLLRDHENLYCDMSANSCFNAMTRDPDYTDRFIDEFGDRMMYGIDACLPADPQVKGMSALLDQLVDEGRISEVHYHGICRENAERILKLQ